jgi:hypothetical protein
MILIDPGKINSDFDQGYKYYNMELIFPTAESYYGNLRDKVVI